MEENEYVFGLLVELDRLRRKVNEFGSVNEFWHRKDVKEQLQIDTKLVRIHELYRVLAKELEKLLEEEFSKAVRESPVIEPSKEEAELLRKYEVGPYKVAYNGKEFYVWITGERSFAVNFGR